VSPGVSTWIPSFANCYHLSPCLNLVAIGGIEIPIDKNFKKHFVLAIKSLRKN